MAERSLLREFREQTGLSFREWTKRARAHHALQKVVHGAKRRRRDTRELGYESTSVFERGELRERRDHRDRDNTRFRGSSRRLRTESGPGTSRSSPPSSAASSSTSTSSSTSSAATSSPGWSPSGENSALAQQLFAEAISRYGIEPGKLIVHQDRGAPMTAHGLAELLSALGVDRHYSRPRVLNDNPHQESLFHTAKYQPDYPGVFAMRGTGAIGATTSSAGTTTTTVTKGSTSSRPLNAR